jgi:CheY-like chemotaxis protein
MSRRILVVEDQEDNRRILRDLLTSAGYEIIQSRKRGRGARCRSEGAAGPDPDGYPAAFARWL